MPFGWRGTLFDRLGILFGCLRMLFPDSGIPAAYPPPVRNPPSILPGSSPCPRHPPPSPAFPAWQLLHNGLKNRPMNGIAGQATFHAVFAPDTPHAVVTG